MELCKRTLPHRATTFGSDAQGYLMIDGVRFPWQVDQIDVKMDHGSVMMLRNLPANVVIRSSRTTLTITMEF